ncbi:hypothetical protein B0H14DRAFT_3133695 [Mycena olivaceomarginata]|nr:hypothetical protein B0H14DRAFT_3133695 [Mycena olivaceomarginata]
MPGTPHHPYPSPPRHTTPAVLPVKAPLGWDCAGATAMACITRQSTTHGAAECGPERGLKGMREQRQKLPTPPLPALALRVDARGARGEAISIPCVRTTHGAECRTERMPRPSGEAPRRREAAIYWAGRACLLLGPSARGSRRVHPRSASARISNRLGGESARQATESREPPYGGRQSHRSEPVPMGKSPNPRAAGTITAPRSGAWSSNGASSKARVGQRDPGPEHRSLSNIMMCSTRAEGPRRGSGVCETSDKGAQSGSVDGSWLSVEQSRPGNLARRSPKRLERRRKDSREESRRSEQAGTDPGMSKSGWRSPRLLPSSLFLGFLEDPSSLALTNGGSPNAHVLGHGLLSRFSTSNVASAAE